MNECHVNKWKARIWNNETNQARVGFSTIWWTVKSGKLHLDLFGTGNNENG